MSPRILHVAAVEATVTGLLLPQLLELKRVGYEVFVACKRDGAAWSPELATLEMHEIEFPRSFDPSAMMKAAVQLRRLVRELGPDLVHFHTPAASFPGRAGIAATRHHPPIVYTVHGYLHLWDDPSVIARTSRVLERLLSRVTALSLFQSREDLEQAVAHSYRGDLQYLGNGVADEWFDDPASPDRPGRPCRLIFVGRVVREKGVEELLGAVEATDGVHLTVVGDAVASDRGSCASALAAAARRMPDRLTCTGRIPPANVRSLLRSSDVFVLPSWREGVPRSVIEAMAAGLPVVTSAIRGCRELVTPGVNGWLVPPRSSSLLAEALREAANLPVEELQAFGSASWRRADEYHRESDIFVRLLRSYDALGLGTTHRV